MNSIRNNRSAVARAAIRQGKRIDLMSPGGLYLGKTVIAPLDLEQVTRIFGWIVRGLYYHLYKVRLPDNQRIEVHRITPEGVEQVAQEFQHLGAAGPFHIGVNTFDWLVLKSGDDARFISWWFMRFFETIFFSVTTMTPEAFNQAPSQDAGVLSVTSPSNEP